MDQMKEEWNEERRFMQQERLQWQKERTQWQRQLADMTKELLKALVMMQKKVVRIPKKHCDLHGPGIHDSDECHHLRRRREEAMGMLPSEDQPKVKRIYSMDHDVATVVENVKKKNKKKKKNPVSEKKEDEEDVKKKVSEEQEKAAEEGCVSKQSRRKKIDVARIVSEAKYGRYFTPEEAKGYLELLNAEEREAVRKECEEKLSVKIKIEELNSLKWLSDTYEIIMI